MSFALTGELRASAAEALDGIAQAFKTFDLGSMASRDLCDLAIFYAYLARHTQSAMDADLSVELVESALTRLSHTPYPSLALYGGLCGIGWSVQHVLDLLQEDTYVVDGDPIEQIDEILLRALKKREWAGDYDLISGLVGIAVYFFERLPREEAVKGLLLVLDQLTALKEESSAGITWFTRPELVPDWQRVKDPDGCYNLGVAHGIPGVIHVLAQLVALEIGGSAPAMLLDGAVDWLIKREQPPEDGLRYSCWFMPGKKPGGSRLGWCYGDLGIASILFQCSSLANRPQWRLRALTLFDSCLERSVAHDSIRDAPLCHGALGVAHIYQRLYDCEQAKRYLDTSCDWYRKGLDFRRPDCGIAGFYSWRPDKSPPFAVEVGLLSGVAGIGLALLSAIDGRESGWDRLLLLSTRKNEK